MYLLHHKDFVNSEFKLWICTAYLKDYISMYTRLVVLNNISLK